MHSFHLICLPEEVDALSAELWELGTEGIAEMERGSDVLLIAGFSDARLGPELLQRFAANQPHWEAELETDWVRQTHDCWPPREVGSKIFLAPPWTEQPTPPGRVRVTHTPGLASGTGEHPCTQLALAAIENHLQTGDTLLDVGAGSGILALAARQLGASVTVGIDTDVDALATARENFHLNNLVPILIAGSLDSLQAACTDLTVANISGSVLLALFDDLLRVTRPGGRLILTGFTDGELPPFLQLLPGANVTALNEWRCITARLS